jgi:peptide chain release factor subunit 1
MRHRHAAAQLPAGGMSIANQGIMARTSPALDTPLRDRLEKLAALEPQDLPVLSLYLNLGADARGRDNYSTFIRKVFAERRKAIGPHTLQRDSFDEDVQRIESYLAGQVNRDANAVAIFACAGAAGLFEAVQLQAPLSDHWLFVGSTPHLYPLAHLVDRYPRYAAVVLDTHRARIFVFSLGGVEHRQEVTSDKMRRSAMGGWSQARYQRHADNWHLLHVKDVVAVLDRVVRDDNVPQIIVAGDEVVVPILKEQLPQHLLDRVIDVVRLDASTAEDEVLRATLEVLHTTDAANDVEAVQQLLDEWQASGLAVVGPEATLDALVLGQVDQLVISATAAALKPVQSLPADAAPGEVATHTSAGAGAADARQVKLAGELVSRAEHTGARIRFIEDASLLEPVGGVGAMLRFRL